MEINFKKTLLAGTAVVALGAIAVVPTAAQAQTIAIEALDNAGGSADDNTIDDLTGFDNTADPSINFDQDDAYVIDISIDDNAAAADDLIKITAGGANAALTINDNKTVSISAGTGDVIVSGDVQIGGGITVIGNVAASAATEDAINLSANTNATVITLTGGATGGSITGAVSLGTGGDTFLINGTDGGADLNGDLIGGAAGAGTLQLRADFLFDSSADSKIDDIVTIDIGDGDTFTISADESIESSSGSTVTVTNTESGTGTFDITGGGADVINFGDDVVLAFTGSATETIVFDVDNAATVNADIQLNTGSVLQSTGGEALTFSATDGANDVILNGGDLRADVTFDATDGGDVVVNVDSTLNNGGMGTITITDATNVTVADGVTLTVGAGNTFASSAADGPLTFDGTNGGGDDIIDFTGNGGVTTVVDLDSNNDGTAGTLTFGANSKVLLDDNAAFDADVTVNGAVTGNLVVISGDASGQIVAFGTGASTTGNVTTTGGNDTVTFTGATIGDASTDIVDLGAGDDTLTIDGGTINSILNGNTGTADELKLVNSDLTIAGTVTGFEDADLQGRTLTLTGTITGLDAAADNGLDVNGGGLIINGSGSITGNIHDAAGAGNGGTIEYGQDTNGGTFTAGGTIDDVGITVTSGTLNTGGFAFGADAALNASSVAADAIFNVNDNVTIDAGDALTNNGTVRVDEDATLTAGTFGGTGTYQIELAVDDSNGTPVADSSIGTMAQSAGAVDLTGTTFELVLTGDALDVSGGTLTFEDVITGTGNATAGTVTDTYLLDLELVDDGANLDLTISQNNTVSDASQSSATFGTANAIETIIATDNITDTELLALSTAIQTSTSAAAVENIVESVSPTVDGSFIAAGIEVANQTGEIITTRLASLRTSSGGESGIVTGNNAMHGIQLWGQGFGSTGDQDARDGVDGFSFDTFGFSVGMDTRNLAEDLTLGMALSYARTEADSDNVNNTETDIDSYFVTLYGDYDFGQGYFVEGMAAYGFGDVDTTRTNVGPGNTIAIANFDSNQWQINAAAGRHLPLENNVTITPRVTANYTYIDPENFEETGAGGVSLASQYDEMGMLEIGLDVELAYDVETNAGLFQPHVNAAYKYEVLDEEVQATTTFVGGGPTFQTEGFDAADHRFEVGAGFTYFTNDNWEFTADYQFDFREDYGAHSGLLKAAYNF